MQFLTKALFATVAANNLRSLEGPAGPAPTTAAPTAAKADAPVGIKADTIKWQKETDLKKNHVDLAKFDKIPVVQAKTCDDKTVTAGTEIGAFYVPKGAKQPAKSFEACGVKDDDKAADDKAADKKGDDKPAEKPAADDKAADKSDDKKPARQLQLGLGAAAAAAKIGFGAFAKWAAPIVVLGGLGAVADSTPAGHAANQNGLVKAAGCGLGAYAGSSFAMNAIPVLFSPFKYLKAAEVAGAVGGCLVGASGHAGLAAGAAAGTAIAGPLTAASR